MRRLGVAGLALVLGLGAGAEASGHGTCVAEAVVLGPRDARGRVPVRIEKSRAESGVGLCERAPQGQSSLELSTAPDAGATLTVTTVCTSSKSREGVSHRCEPWRPK